nr:MAG TPA: hypothetical protein [Caudoviricetes sp.]DAT65028.1 MAG TPA: hypothetical protein [Caudoviricetes sp.]
MVKRYNPSTRPRHLEQMKRYAKLNEMKFRLI